MTTNTISYNKLGNILTKRLNKLADQDQKDRERRMKRRLKTCNEYYLPEHRYTRKKIDGRNYILDAYGRLYNDIENTIKTLEKTIGLC